jgi:hypothetical protein
MLTGTLALLLLASAPVDVPGDAALSEQSATWERRALSAGAAALGAGTGVLLALPASVPGIYLAASMGMSPFVGALPLLVAVPIAVAAGSAVAVSGFTSGIGPYLVAGGAATVGGLTALLVGALVAPNTPPDPTALHLGVLSVVAVPTLAAAGAAAVVAPFVTDPATAAEAEVE